MWGVKGIDHLAKPGCLARVLAGSYPSGPSSAEPPEIWKMITSDAIPAYNVPSGIMFDIHREAAAKRPGVLTKIGMDTFVDPVHQGCAMNAKAAADPIVERVRFAGDEWLFFPSIIPQVAIIRATTADERGNLSYEHEGGILGPLDQALAVRNNGGVVIAQVKRLAAAGTLKPHDVSFRASWSTTSWSRPISCRRRTRLMSRRFRERCFDRCPRSRRRNSISPRSSPGALRKSYATGTPST
jgi:propionate CoA-transferase